MGSNMMEGIVIVPLSSVKAIGESIETVQPEQIKEIVDYFKRVGELDKPLLVTRGKGAYDLIGNYPQYCAAQELGLNEVPTEMGTEQELSTWNALRTKGTRVRIKSLGYEKGTVIGSNLTSTMVRTDSGQNMPYYVHRALEDGVMLFQEANASTVDESPVEGKTDNQPEASQSETVEMETAFHPVEALDTKDAESAAVTEPNGVQDEAISTLPNQFVPPEYEDEGVIDEQDESMLSPEEERALTGEDKLDYWAKKLLDVGKRNPLINYKDRKDMTTEVVCPDPQDFFDKLQRGTTLEVYDPFISEYEPLLDDEPREKGRLSKEEYIAKYRSRLRKVSQILTFNAEVSAASAMKKIYKKGVEAQEESGLNVIYAAFGFLTWKESDSSQKEYKAPLLLIPIRIIHDNNRGPFFVEILEDDVVVNPAFSYNAKSSFGIELPFFADEDTLDSYYTKVDKVCHREGWIITTEVKIGIFSFQKINMYTDLKNNMETILANHNIRLLLGEADEAIDGGDVGFDRESVHLENELLELHTVVDADSSQMEAIELAKAGKSFVLQGPPGTGKSQTITNIVAECLYDGKKVLFVSEKQAALNVVYDKLKKAGLEDFCLELHSHKSNKKAFIEELNRTLQLQATHVPMKAANEVQRKASTQKQLDDYAIELHKEIPGIGKSMYQLFETEARFRQAPELDYYTPNIESKSEQYFSDVYALLVKYVGFVPSIGDDYRKNLWYGYKGKGALPEDRSYLKRLLEKIQSGLVGLLQEARNQGLDYDLTAFSVGELEYLKDFYEVLGKAKIFDPDLYVSNSFPGRVEEYKKLAAAAISINTEKNYLDSVFEPEIYNLDGRGIHIKLTKQFNGFFSRFFNKEYKDIVTQLRLASRNGIRFSYKNAVKSARSLRALEEAEADYGQYRKLLNDYLGEAFDNDASLWEEVAPWLESLKRVYDCDFRLEKIVHSNSQKLRSNQQSYSTMARAIEACIETIHAPFLEYAKSFDREFVPIEGQSIRELLTRVNACLNDIDRLSNWVQFAEIIEQIKQKEALPFVNQAIDAAIPAEKIPDTFGKAFYQQWINLLISKNPVLRAFNRISQDKAVKEFSESDKNHFAINKAQIREKLSAERPNLDYIAPGSPAGIIRHEGGKKRKQKSIRQLLDEAGEMIQVIKPCFLMSPLSVSTFLTSGKIHFDTVIFDEASQIFPEDALGAIYRADSAIVVGDTKQMPPTNFFNSTADDENIDDQLADISDFDSILEVAMTVFRSSNLLWHYRSRYEQLIAYSNKNFYDGHLITFPSSAIDRKDIGVDYYHVDGIFDKKSHTNRVEAEKVVELILEHIQKYPDRSLGVVAFSTAQQDLIERLISQRRISDPGIEPFFAQSKKEPFFVKNLETVQGDERDTIIFSNAYGKYADGKRSNNFGPLNNQGGGRRLNVAVTRAKVNVKLVTSMHHTDIDIKNSKHDGPRLLKEYLDYAEHGVKVLEKQLTVSEEDQFDSDFEEEVCEFLRSQGYTVDTQVGCSGYRIDLGVRREESSDYVLAVECDGASYHSSKNARDRDRLRQEILESMGWKFYRIWSTDWFRNKSVEKERLLEHVKAAFTNTPEMVPVASSEKEETPADSFNEYETQINHKSFTFPQYRKADVVSILQGNLNDFQRKLRLVLALESPLSEEWLLKRIVIFFDGREKVTKAVKERFEDMMYGCEQVGIVRRNGFMYLQDKTEYTMRVPGEKRDIKYVAPEELQNGMLHILQENLSVQKDDLFRMIVKLLGFQKVSESMGVTLDAALAGMTDKVLIEGDMVSLK